MHKSAVCSLVVVFQSPANVYASVWPSVNESRNVNVSVRKPNVRGYASGYVTNVKESHYHLVENARYS